MTDVAPLEQPPVRAMVLIAADVCGVPPADVLSGNQTARVSLARHLVCFVGTTVYQLGPGFVGGEIGRDHASVLYGRDRIQRLARCNHEIARVLRELLGRLKNRGPDVEAVMQAVVVPVPDPEPELPPAAAKPKAPSPIAVDPQFYALRRKGWSVKSLARRFDMLEPIAAELVGAPWPGNDGHHFFGGGS